MRPSSAPVRPAAAPIARTQQPLPSVTACSCLIAPTAESERPTVVVLVGALAGISPGSVCLAPVVDSSPCRRLFVFGSSERIGAAMGSLPGPRGAYAYSFRRSNPRVQDQGELS